MGEGESMKKYMLALGCFLLLVTLCSQGAFERLKRFFRQPAYVYDKKISLQDNLENIVVNFELPGYTKENIKVSATPYTLTVSAYSLSMHPNNLPVRTFKQIISLPVEIVTSGVSAVYENGMVTINAPKILSHVQPSASVVVK